MSASPLKTRLSETMKSSLKSGDKETLSFARNLHAAIRKKEIDDKIELVDADVQKLVGTLLKQRQDSVTQYEAGQREDLAAKERLEITFLKTYMPEEMSDAELESVVDWAFKESNATSQKDMGKLMALLMPKVQGRADGKKIQTLVKQRLGG